MTRGNIDGFDALLAIHQNFTPQYFPPIIRNTIIISGCNTRGETRGGRASGVTMSILKYFKSAKENSQNELPDPSGSLSKEIAIKWQAVICTHEYIHL